MAATLSFKFVLSKHIGVPPPSVAIFVDVNGDGHLADTEKVDLVQEGLTWTGAKQLNSESSKGIEFIIWFRGSMGAEWAFEVSSDEPSAHVVARDSQPVHSVPQTAPGECAP